MSIIQLTKPAAAGAAKPCPFKPSRYLVLLKMREVPEKRGSFLIPPEEVDRMQVAETIGQVIAVGEDAFKDEKKFPSGAPAKVGDWVDTKRYVGDRRCMGSIEYRYIADTDILGTVDNPDEVDPYTLKTRL